MPPFSLRFIQAILRYLSVISLQRFESVVISARSAKLEPYFILPATTIVGNDSRRKTRRRVFERKFVVKSDARAIIHDEKCFINYFHVL